MWRFFTGFLLAQRIVDRALRLHGGDVYEQLDLRLRRGDWSYHFRRRQGLFTYTRSYAEICDVLNNKGFYREIQGQRQQLSETQAKAFQNSLNSVAYFTLLPYGLNDPAVIRRYLGRERLLGEPYHRIEVRFRQEGGGEDFEDRFIYWFHARSGYMDYLAYEYHTEGGGMRFRKALRARQVAGVRIQDYANYAADPARWRLEDLGRAFEAERLELLSEIRME